MQTGLALWGDATVSVVLSVQTGIALVRRAYRGRRNCLRRVGLVPQIGLALVRRAEGITQLSASCWTCSASWSDWLTCRGIWATQLVAPAS